MKYPTTPDLRYFVVRGRLWRMSNPNLSEDERDELTWHLMNARRAVMAAKRKEDAKAEAAAHAEVNELKIALGERGPVWWTDGAPDYNRHKPAGTPYERWYKALFPETEAS